MLILFLLGNFFFLQILAEDKQYSLVPSNWANFTANNFTYCQNKNCTWTASYTLQGYVARISPEWLLPNNNLDRLLIQANDGATIIDTNKEGLLSLADDFYAAEKGFTITFTAGSHQGDCLVAQTSGLDCLWLITMQLVKNPEVMQLNMTSNSPVTQLASRQLRGNKILEVYAENGATLDLFSSGNDLGDIDVFKGTDGLNWTNHLGTVWELNNKENSLAYDASGQLKPVNLTYPLTMVYTGTVDNNQLLFRNREKLSANCQDSNNIFKIYEGKLLNVVYSANSTGDCVLSFLCDTDVNQPCLLQFNNINYKGDKDLIGTRGFTNDTILFAFDSNSTSLWNNVYFYANPFSLIIPQNGQISIDISAAAQGNAGSNIYTPRKISPNTSGILMSPQYPRPNCTNQNQTATYLQPAESTYTIAYELNFVGFDLSGNSNLQFFDNSDLKLSFNASTKTPIPAQNITSGNLTVMYTPDNTSTEKGYLIQYKALKEELPPTTKPTGSSPQLTSLLSTMITFFISYLLVINF
uniref:CUB domain-containing protein n=1 Tax=Acrobeloides nanus TaxID=290746 RepID=A0A914DA55_9BILA